MRGRGSPFNPFQGRIVYSVLVALLIFILCQFGLVYREVTILEEQRVELKEELQEKTREAEDLRLHLNNKQRDVHRLQRRLNDLENRLRGRRDSLRGRGERTIYVITPTKRKPTQKADLTRLSHTFMHVPNLFWILIDDAPHPNSSLVREVLTRSGLKHAHLAAETPAEYKLRSGKDPNWLKPRGVLQRNAGLRYLRTNFAQDPDGVVYFADDDNTYDLRLFEEMRLTEKVSVWPVGLVGGLMVERPLVDAESGRVSGWLTAWRPDRPFALDMAGFAVRLRLLLEHPEAEFSYAVARGFQESHLLRQLIRMEQLEPRADLCSKIYVWHTNTADTKLKNELALRQSGKRSDDGMEV